MPRDSQGLYTLPPGNPVTPGTVIESEWANETLADVGDALTGSLPRSGSAPMTGLLTLAAADPVSPRHATTKQYVDQFVAYSTGMPIGSIVAFAAGIAPGGFLLCNGQAVNRTTYSDLFALIGTSFGAGDGLTTFNVPNIQDQFIRGRGTGRLLGSIQSDATRSHTHSISDPGHNHTQATHSHSVTVDPHTHGVTDPGHNHTNIAHVGTAGPTNGLATSTSVSVENPTNRIQTNPNTTGVSVNAAGATGSTSSATAAIAAATTGVTVGATGDTETRPQNIAFDYYIKAAQDAAGPLSLLGVTSSDENMIAVDLSSPSFPELVIKSNMAFGTVKLDGSGKVPVAVMPFAASAFLGYFDASTNQNPSEKYPTTDFNSGDFYLVAIPGTVNVFDPVTLVSSPTAVAVGDTLSFVENSTTNPTGWYKSAAATAVSASAVSLIPVGGISATNVQAAVAELDSEKAPSSASTAVGTSFTPAGSISAVNVQAAIEELDADVALKQNIATAVQKTSSTGSAVTPAGTTAERDVTPFFGYFRANSSLVALEWWNGSTWVTIGDVTLSGAQALTNKTITDPTNTVYANAGPSNSPFSHRNKIINGKMDIAQRGTSFAAASGYTLDRWGFFTTSAAVATVTQQGEGPSSGEFQYSLRSTITTADTSIAAGDLAIVYQRIEGFNVRDLIGKNFSISFWVRSSKTGTHCVSLRNNIAATPDRSYVAEYTINAANTWEFKTVTVSGGLIAAGTWNWTNGAGIDLSFVLACGSTFQTAAGAWQTGNFLATSNQVNVLDTIGNIFAITGVQLEVGAVATPFEHRPIGTELALCQRYYWKNTAAAVSGAYAAGVVDLTTNAALSYPSHVRMRTAPTLTWSSLRVYDGTASSAVSAMVITSTADFDGHLLVATVAGLTAPRPALLQGNGGSSYIALSAEL